MLYLTQEDTVSSLRKENMKTYKCVRLSHVEIRARFEGILINIRTDLWTLADSLEERLAVEILAHYTGDNELAKFFCKPIAYLLSFRYHEEREWEVTSEQIDHALREIERNRAFKLKHCNPYGWNKSGYEWEVRKIQEFFIRKMRATKT